MIKTWFLACRPKTLIAAFSPVCIGTILAFQKEAFDPLTFIAILAAATGIQIGTNFANDYFDAKKGSDTPNRLGPKRATASGTVSEDTMKRVFISAFAISFIIGIYLMIRGGLPIVAIGLSSIAAGILYTGGPKPLGYHGLGDLFAFLFFGPIATGGTYYLYTLNWSVESLVIGCAPGLFSVAMIAINNLRDLPEDKQTGKKTLAVLLGSEFTRKEITFAICLAASLPLIPFESHQGLQRMAVWVLVPAYPLLKIIWKQEGIILNKSLGQCGAIMSLFTLLYCVGRIL